MFVSTSVSMIVVIAPTSTIAMTTNDAFTYAETWKNMADGDIIEREENPSEIIERAKKFLQNGCACSRGSKGGACSREFKEEAVLFNLNNCLELTSGQLDLIILANI